MERASVGGKRAVVGECQLVLVVLACCKVPAALAHLPLLLPLVLDISGLPARNV